MTRIVLVGVGGFFGAVCRYGLAGAVHRLGDSAFFPWGTLAVNAIGCLAIGVVAGLVEFRGVLSPEARLVVVIGFLGGFTTFSSFGYETFQLLRDGQTVSALSNVVLQLAAGMAGVWAGFALAKI